MVHVVAVTASLPDADAVHAPVGHLVEHEIHDVFGMKRLETMAATPQSEGDFVNRRQAAVLEREDRRSRVFPTEPPLKPRLAGGDDLQPLPPSEATSMVSYRPRSSRISFIPRAAIALVIWA